MAELPVNGISAPSLTSVAILLLAWSLLSFAIRLWVKLQKSNLWAADDTVISISLLVAVLHVIAICVATTHGYGADWADDATAQRTIAQKALYASQILYVTSVSLTRMSASLFVFRLVRDSHKTWIVKLLSGLCGAITIASIFLVAIRGNWTEPWTTMNGSQLMFVRWLFVEVLGLIVEPMLWGSATWFIWQLQMPLRKRIFISSMLTIRLVLILLVVLRLLYLSPTRNSHIISAAITADTYAELVLQLGLIVSSITCAKSFLKPFHSGLFINLNRSQGSRYIQENTADPNNSYRMIDKVNSDSDPYSSASTKDLNPTYTSPLTTIRTQLTRQSSNYTD